MARPMNGAGAMIETVLARPAPAAHGSEGGVGFVGTDLPMEVFCASGRPFGHLPWRTSRETEWADRWLESSFPDWARSILQQWHDGVFDALEQVVFSRADDASQRLYYYVTELQRRKQLAGPRPVVFDVALLPRQTSIAHTAAAILELARVLGVDDDQLRVGIERVNDLRSEFAAIESQRSGGGAFYERLGRAALWSDPTQWIERVDLPEPSPPVPRVLLAGSVPPDDRLHRVIDAARATVVTEAHAFGFGRLGAIVDPSADRPERVLAKHLQRFATGPRASLDRARWLVARARAARADAAVIWLTREDEALAWHVPAQRRALQESGVPAVIVHAATWHAGREAFDQITNFLRNCKHATT